MKIKIILLNSIFFTTFLFTHYLVFGETENNQEDSNLQGKIVLDYEDCLALAIKNNFELKAVDASGLIAEETINEKLRQLFPSFSVSYSQTEERSIRETDSRYHKVSFNSELTVYDSGRKYNDYKIAKLQAVISRNDYSIELNRFIYQVTSQFFQLLQAKKTILIYQKTLEQAKVQEAFVEKELKLGEATIYDMQQIQNKVNEVELNLTKTTDNFYEKLNSFKLLLNIHRTTKTHLVGNIEKDFEVKPLNTKYTIDNLIPIAIQNRKEIEQSELEYQISQNSHFYAKHYYLPNISVGANYDLTGEEFFPREKSWGVTVTASTALFGNTANTEQGYTESKNGNSSTYSNTSTVNVLDNMDYKRNQYETEIDLKRKYLNKTTIKNQIGLEIETAYHKMTNAYKLINISLNKYTLSKSLVEVEEVKVKIGESRRYDLVKQIIDASQSEIEYISSITQYLSAGSELELALGKNIGFLKTQRD